MNKEQKESVNSKLLHKNIVEHNEKSGNHTRTRYRRIVQKTDKMTYKITLYINMTYRLISLPFIV